MIFLKINKTLLRGVLIVAFVLLPLIVSGAAHAETTQNTYVKAANVFSVLSEKVYCGIRDLFGKSCDESPTEIPALPDENASSQGSAPAQVPFAERSASASQQTVVERVMELANSTLPAPLSVAGVSQEYLDSRLVDLAAQLRSEMSDRTVVVRSSSGPASNSNNQFVRQIDQIYDDFGESKDDLREDFAAGDEFLRSELLAAISSSSESVPAGPTGYILQSTGTTTQWVATSSLGITSSQWGTNGTSVYHNGGNVGIGTTTPVARLDIVDGDSVFGTSDNALRVNGLTSFTNVETGSYYRPVAMAMNFTAAPAIAPGVSTDFHGTDIVLRGSNSNLNSLARLYAFESTATYGGSGTLGSLYAGYFQGSNTGSGAVNESTALRLWTQNTGNGSIGDARGLYIQNPNNTGSGSIANNYGIYIEEMSAATGNNFGIYSIASRNYLAGITTLKQTINATTSQALVVNQASSPGTDAIAFNVNHTANFYPFRVANSGAYGPIFTSTTNGGDSFTVRKNGTGNGVAAKIINAGTGNTLEAGPSGSPNFVITSGGNVGIGTTTPDAPFVVSNTSGTTMRLNSTNGAIMSFGTAGTAFGVIGSGSSAVLGGGANDLGIRANAGNNLLLAAGGAIEGMRLTPAGNVGIGTTSPQRRLHVYTSADEAPVRFEDASGYCEINPTSTTWTCTSDERLKENIETLSSTEVLAKIGELRPVTFSWKSDGAHEERLGLIAQEVEQIFPDLVSSDPKTKMKAVAYGGFTTYLISAVQELTARVESFTAWFAGNRFNVQGEVCVDSVCITKEEFKNLLRSGTNVHESIDDDNDSVPTPSDPPTGDGSDGGGDQAETPANGTDVTEGGGSDVPDAGAPVEGENSGTVDENSGPSSETGTSGGSDSAEGEPSGASAGGSSSGGDSSGGDSGGADSGSSNGDSSGGEESGSSGGGDGGSSGV